MESAKPIFKAEWYFGLKSLVVRCTRDTAGVKTGVAMCKLATSHHSITRRSEPCSEIQAPGIWCVCPRREEPYFRHTGPILRTDKPFQASTLSLFLTTKVKSTESAP